MKLSKFQHACFTIEKEGSTLLVDPGAFSHDLIIPKKVDGIIITHEHPDHFDEKIVQKVLADNPKAVIAAPERIAARFSDYATIPMATGQQYTIGSYTLQFFGGTHASITRSTQAPANFGVFIDSKLYYPGDSFVTPENTSIDILALPVSAPWLKISESLDFLLATKPRVAFPTHDAILSEDGKGVVDRLVSNAAGTAGIIYKRLDGVSLEV